jgi:hypothetical protein
VQPLSAVHRSPPVPGAELCPPVAAHQTLPSSQSQPSPPPAFASELSLTQPSPRATHAVLAASRRSE